MDRLPSKTAVERLRARFPKGTRVELIKMDDPYTEIETGI